jgi:hypothetical protein
MIYSPFNASVPGQIRELGRRRETSARLASSDRLQRMAEVLCLS